MENKHELVTITGLKTHFFTDEGVVRAVDGVDFSIPDNKTLCVVGESGCGKSITARSILQLIDYPGRIVDGSIVYHAGEDIDLAALDSNGQQIRSIRGREISMIFQEPMTSLSPVHTIGRQITEALRIHLGLEKDEARERAIQALGRVGIPKPAQRIDTYTFELSGGMRQRAMIAMALACEPRLLLADEPTTALDVTTQATILDLISEIQESTGMAVVFITHDLGVVAEIADEVVVMYLGTVAEKGPVDRIFHDPLHPYTKALLKSIPKLGQKTGNRLHSIRGMVPHPFNRPKGCPFHTRCDSSMPGICDTHVPPREVLDDGREVRCLLHSNLEALDAHQ
jgi:peptide/nickel transport system ATP-binding protein